MVDWRMGVSDPRAFYEGNDYVNKLYDMQAQKAAGAKIASGDLRGAAADIGGRGDVAGALNLTQQAMAGERQAKIDAQSDADRKVAQFKERQQFVQMAVPKLTAVFQKGGPQALLEFFGKLGPTLQQGGVTPEEIAQYGQAFQQDPQSTLDRLGAFAKIELAEAKAGDDVVLYNKATGEEVYRHKAPPKEPVAPTLAGQVAAANNPFNPDGSDNLRFQEYETDKARKLAEDRRLAVVNNPVAPQANPRQTQQMSVQLRKEFNQLPDVKNFNDVANSFEIINDIATRANAAESAGGKPSAADDMSMIFAYMKMLDPGSVVREGEFANAQNTAGIPDQVRNAYNRALNGNRLNQKQRTDFANTAKGVYQSRQKRYDQLVREYKGYAVDSGLEDDTISSRISAGDGAPPQGVVPPDVDALVGKYLGGR